MSDERTPLIAVVHVAPLRERYAHSALRRFCSIALGSLLIAVVVLFFIPVEFLPENHRGHHHGEHHGESYSAAFSHHPCLNRSELQEILLTTPDEQKAREWSHYYSAGPHLAGKNLSQALWTKDLWEEFGIKSEVLAYDIYINYPVDHRLALLKLADNNIENFEITYEASLKEDILEEDPTTGLPDQIPTFHGYSASGNVTAPYVYVNFGTFQDFEDLVKANVSLKGKIALAKYGGIFRGLKLKRAQELGMIGAILYTDPQEDGDVTEINGYETYPNGPARNPSSVQRGSTSFLSLLPGDPTTPGYASKPGVPRTDPHYSTPTIPSIPISYMDALPLLNALNGHGPEASDFGEAWQGGGLTHKGVKYNIGPSPDDVVLNLMNEQEYVTTPLWDVIGIINGTIPDEAVVIGNHRDAWIAGGSGDPNSGSAALNEAVRSFGKALEAGYRPLRTIVFASWDGEEYNLIGSTEWVEDHLPWLDKKSIAYINLDDLSGTEFSASASPLLIKPLHEVTKALSSPNQTVSGQTVFDLWGGYTGTMGSGSDFTAFQDFAGVPSLTFTFGRRRSDPVYHYHSIYDSFYWMDKFGDPTWQYHTTAAKVINLLTVSLVETPVINFNATDYAVGLKEYLNRAKQTAITTSASFSFEELDSLLDQIEDVAKEFDAHAATLALRLGDSIPWWKWWQKVRLLVALRKVNDKYKYLERQLLYPEGLDGRSFFKHVVFAPGRWTGYAGATFPGLIESFEDGNSTNAERWGGIIQERLSAIVDLLK